jgi:hypothetical protein
MAKRQIQCPICAGEVLTQKSGKPFASINAFLQRAFSIRIPDLKIISWIKERTPVKAAAILKNNCGYCGGDQTIDDPTDFTDEQMQVKSNFDAAKQEIEDNEKLLGACGNRYTIIQGSDLLEVGLGMNDVASYRTDKEKDVANGKLVDPGEGDMKKGGPQTPKGTKRTLVTGTNPPASPGGHYVIKCSNRFSVLAGAQGIDFTTNGPITFNGGITQITGPQVTIGTSTGRLVLEGETVNMNGKSVEITPSDGTMFLKGTFNATGNSVVGGHSHAESASIVNLETTGKNESSKVGSPGNIYGGPAFWGGPAVEGIQAALKSLVSYVLLNTTNPEHAKIITSPRFLTGIQDELTNLLYVARPEELVQTGYALYLGIQLPVFNFPHIHAMPDQMHVHETRVPDIKCDADDAESLRKQNAGMTGSAPLTKNKTSFMDALKGLWEGISEIFVGTAIVTQQSNYNK